MADGVLGTLPEGCERILRVSGTCARGTFGCPWKHEDGAPSTFAERCRIAQECLPDAEYRSRLKALHDDMLAAIDGVLGTPETDTKGGA